MATQLPKPKVRVSRPRFTPSGPRYPPRINRGQPGENLKDTISAEELKARKRKYLAYFAASYGVILAGSYYYISYGVATGGPFEKPLVQDTTSIYENLADAYDGIVNKSELFMVLSTWRKYVARKAKGDVLEVSCGTGRNINYLDLPQIKSMTFVDASAKMVEQTKEKFKERHPKYQNVSFIATKAEDLPTDKKYDVIYETFGLCSQEDPVVVLLHLQELLKPGGQIVLLEHGQGTYDFINRVLDKHALRHSVLYGCRWNLDIGDIVRRSGLVIDEESRSHLGTTWTIVAHRAGDVVPKEPKKRFLIW